MCRQLVNDREVEPMAMDLYIFQISNRGCIDMNFNLFSVNVVPGLSRRVVYRVNNINLLPTCSSCIR